MGLAEEVVGPLRASVEGGSFAEAVLERMWELEALEGPIDLRLGEYLAMLFGPSFDARKIDYANFGAFAVEELDMDRTWGSRIMALGRSDLSRVKEALCRGWIPISTAVLAVKDVEPEEQRLIRGYRFLTLMPQLVLVNVDEADVASPDAVLAPLRDAAAKHRGSAVVSVCAKIEAEIAELPPDEAAAFRAELGLSEAPLDRVVHATYDLLGLTSFFTAGEDEVRAWTVYKGSTAQQAAGAIHSDLERGFIRAEVIRWDELLKAGSEANARKQALMRTEGKSYLIQDGDTMNVLFNV